MRSCNCFAKNARSCSNCCSDSRVMASALLAHAGCTGVELVDTQSLQVETNDVNLFRHAVASVASHYDVALFDVSPLDDDLEPGCAELLDRLRHEGDAVLSGAGLPRHADRRSGGRRPCAYRRHDAPRAADVSILDLRRSRFSNIGFGSILLKKSVSGADHIWQRSAQPE